jgi:hypothetical protein
MPPVDHKNPIRAKSSESSFSPWSSASGFLTARLACSGYGAADTRLTARRATEKWQQGYCNEWACRWSDREDDMPMFLTLLKRSAFTS